MAVGSLSAGGRQRRGGDRRELAGGLVASGRPISGEPDGNAGLATMTEPEAGGVCATAGAAIIRQAIVPASRVPDKQETTLNGDMRKWHGKPP